MTRYTIAFYVAGIVAGVLLTRARRHLTSPWLWGGVALSIIIVLPNLIWQAQHNFISLEFLSNIHARDVSIGRTSDFIIDQFRVSANPFTLPLWIAGLYFYFLGTDGRRYRTLGWMAVVPFALFWIAQGRGYYTGPIYPMLFAAGSVWFERGFATLPHRHARVAQGISWTLIAVGGAIVLALGPYWPVGSAQWQTVSEINTDLKEEIGWPELVQTVAGIYAGLPAETKPHTGILAGNYGVAGAIDLYGPAYPLPKAISGVNSYWLRGYGNPAPQTLIVVGATRGFADRFFSDCELAGHVSNIHGVRNEETVEHPEIFICRGARELWPQVWQELQSFG